MELKEVFNRAMSLGNYEEKLGDGYDLHRLHYRKFQTDDIYHEVISWPGYKILVITEPWCGDSLALVPVVRKLAETNGKWEIRVLLRDENPDLMDHFLTRGARGIPVFLFLDQDDNLLFRFGPRPQNAQKIYEEHRSMIEAGKIEKQTVIKKIRAFYAKDRGSSIYNDLKKMIDNLNNI